MRVVCDTNVLISGILFAGHPREILRRATRGVVHNSISPDILQEMEQALLRPKFNLSVEQVNSIIQLMRDSFEIVYPTQRVKIVTRDPDDNRILEAALAAQAEYIISGDKDLLAVERWRDIRIVSPADFMKF